MVKATCKQILKDNKGGTTGYTIVDEAYNEKNYTTNELYRLIICDEIDIDNLIYDGLSMTFKFNLTKRDEDAKLKSLLNRATVLGLYTREIKLGDNKPIYYIRKSEDSHIIYIPKDVEYIQTTSFVNRFYRLMTQIHGTVSFMGGEGLLSTNTMFVGCDTGAIIDLTQLKLSNIRDMSKMFMQCKFEKVIFGNVKADKLEFLQQTFYTSTIKEIQMGGIEAENVMNFKLMFNKCKSEIIDISGLSGANAQYKLGREAFKDMFGQTWEDNKTKMLKINIKCPFILEALNS